MQKEYIYNVNNTRIETEVMRKYELETYRVFIFLIFSKLRIKTKSKNR